MADDDGNITVYLRMRPTRKPSKFYDVQGEKLSWDIPADDEVVNNTHRKFAFKFNQILPMDITQEQVFERVGQRVVDNALSGFNSTIFAYGQTGSGKTFTMTGGAERYEDRGLIPRALSMIFREFRERSDVKWAAHISYMEIYNEQGYDLLEENRSKVRMLEDENGNFHLKNLSLHRAASDEDALNLLFIGDTNRAISETAMNAASSRSHCIFTVFIEGRRVGSDRVLRSKLNMVDLAGSERVHKTKSDGQILKEAGYINASLFYLELVIRSLSEKSREHIPYRNSMMTTVLRDSLGGNCKTAMVATVSAEREQTDESISTCRFAQRVARVKNDATVNEDVDPAIAIARLKAQVASLEAELSFVKGEAGEGDSLTEGERQELNNACQEYVASRDPNEGLRVAPLTLVRIKDCFAILKNLVLGAQGASERPDDGSARPDIAKLQSVLSERDKEIAILVNMVRQAKGAAGLAGATHPRNGDRPKDDKPRPVAAIKKHHVEAAIGGVACAVDDNAVLDDPRRAYDYFRDKAKTNAALEENKALLKGKYSDAKRLGEQVNQSRHAIAYLKKTIEQLRRERAIDGIHDSQLDVPSAEEEEKKEAIEKEKLVYKDSFDKLRALKTEIETIQRMLEVGRARLQADFDRWYDEALKQVAGDPPAKATTRQTRSAWPTPVRSVAPHDAPAAAQPKRVVPVTGHQDTDDDIRAFYRAKEELAQLQAKMAA